MPNIKKILMVALVFIGVGVVGGALTFASKGGAESVIEEAEFDVGQIEQIDISSDNAKVEVLRASQSSSKVKVISEGRDYRLSSGVEGQTLAIEMTHKRNRLFNINMFDLGATLKVYVPEKHYASLNLESNNGKVVVKDINIDDMKVDTDNGKIELQQINSESIYAETNNGHILLDQVSGDLVGRTNNGAISLKTDHIDRPIDLKTDNGKIEVKMDKEPTNIVFDLKTGNGKIKVFGQSDWNTMIGNGDHLVKLRTANGRITVSR